MRVKTEKKSEGGVTQTCSAAAAVTARRDARQNAESNQTSARKGLPKSTRYLGMFRNNVGFSASPNLPSTFLAPTLYFWARRRTFFPSITGKPPCLCPPARPRSIECHARAHHASSAERSGRLHDKVDDPSKKRPPSSRAYLIARLERHTA